MNSQVTYCRECGDEVSASDTPKGFLYDLCSKHYKASKEQETIEPKPNTAYESFTRQAPEKVLRGFGVPSRAAKDATIYWIGTTALKNFLDDTDYDTSFYLQGQAGTGKTVLSAAILYEYARAFARGKVKGKGIYKADKFIYTSIPDFLFRLRQSYKANTPIEDDLVQRMCRCSMLVLDDLGVEKTSDWTLSTLYLIVDSRYQAFRPTIVTSNLSLDELTNRMEDGRIASRIHGWCSVRAMDSKDLRGNAK